MAEYIEREVISQKIRKYYYKNPPNSSYEEGFDRGLDRAQRAILDAPSADVVPVVRCKDCKHHHDCEIHFCDALDMGCPGGSKFFCSYGERKDGDGNG